MHIAGSARSRIRGVLAAVLVCSAALSGTARGQDAAVQPAFAIWDVKLGQPVADVPDSAAAVIACGTNGGPISIELKSFADWAECTPETSGLREVTFTYDDEKDFIALALELEYRALAGGTSVYAHPVVLSILVDDKGLAQGIRVVTDDRAKDRDRRTAVTLGENLPGAVQGLGARLPGYPDAGAGTEGGRHVHPLALLWHEPRWQRPEAADRGELSAQEGPGGAKPRHPDRSTRATTSRRPGWNW